MAMPWEVYSYESFREEMLQYGDFSEEELKEMYDSEMLAECDL